MKSKVIHQFGLFGFVKPKLKVPISAERIKEAKKLFENGDTRGAVDTMRDVRERLENFERRINHKNNGGAIN